MAGKLIVVEGPDGVGKTTLCKKLWDCVPDSVYYSFPGNLPGTLGAHIYNLHHNPQSYDIDKKIPPICLQALHITAHIDLIENYIIPDIDADRIVILDRYWWSTWVYGCVYGADRRQLGMLIDLEKDVWGELSPDAMVVLERHEPFEPDYHTKEQWDKLSEHYVMLALHPHPYLYTVADYEDGGPTIQTVINWVLDRLS